MEVEVENKEVGQLEIDNELPKVDGRTAEGKTEKVQARLKNVEDVQEKILEILSTYNERLNDHEKRIAECSIRR